MHAAFKGLARRVRARLLFASTSEVYGDPEVHPQKESYFGNVNSFGPRACYDESKRVAEAMCYAYAQQVRRGGTTDFCTNLFYRKVSLFELLEYSTRTDRVCT